MTFEFPQSFAEKYRPKQIDAFVGLEKPKAIMRKLAVNPFPSAWIFIGPSGTGKTTMGLQRNRQLRAALLIALPSDRIFQLWHVPRCNHSPRRNLGSRIDTTFKPNFPQIVKESANNVRECLMRLETEKMAH